MSPNEVQTAIRLPQSLVDEADDLVPVLASAPEFKLWRITRSAVLRLAVERGLAALRADYSAAPNDTAAPPKKR